MPGRAAAGTPRDAPPLRRTVQKFVLNAFVIPALYHVPFSTAYGTFRALGELRRWVQGGKRRRVRERVAKLLGRRRDDPEIDEIVRHLFINAMKTRGREFLYANLTDAQLDQVVTMEGLPYVDAALARGKGVVLLGSHVGPGRMICYFLRRKGYPLIRSGVGMMGHLDKKWLARIDRYETARLEAKVGRVFQDILLPIKLDPAGYTLQLRKMLSALKGNNVLYMAADGRATSNPVFASFLGHRVGFPPGWVSLARLSGAAAIPTFALFSRGSDVLRVIFEEPLPPELFQDGTDMQKAVDTYVDRLQWYITHYPDNAPGIFFGKIIRRGMDFGWGEGFPPV